MALDEVLSGVNTDNMEKIEQGMVGLYSRFRKPWYGTKIYR